MGHHVTSDLITRSPAQVQYVVENKMVYWSDVDLGVVRRASLEGTGQ